MSSKAEEFERFVRETLRPDYLRTIECREKILDECREYEILLLSIQKMTVRPYLFPFYITKFIERKL